MPNFGIEPEIPRQVVRERKHRLPNERYVGELTVSFTLCVAARQRAFEVPDVVEALTPLLADSLQRYACVAPVYCFMPDHLHVLVRGATAESSCKGAIDNFKGASGRWFAHSGFGARWQKDYHDHVIRSHEDWRAHAFYIFHNPIRAGLVQDPFEYPHTGSVGFELREVIRETW
ncbi:MAG: REP-associated tyrosine transposase [Fimbriimonadaceae bacterium]